MNDIVTTLVVLAGLVVLLVAVGAVSVYRRMAFNTAQAMRHFLPSPGDEAAAVVRAVVDLHRPQVMDRRHDSDVHSTITTVCGACSNVAGEPVPFPCTTIGTIRRERQRIRGAASHG